MELVSVKKLENNQVELQVAVDAVEFAPALEAAYRKNAPKVNIPGFRKGKAPKAMIEKQYGPLMVEEAVNALYPIVYNDAVAKADIEPVDQADVVIEEASSEGFKFTATVTVRPEIKLGQYKGLSGTRKAASIEEKDVEETLSRLQERGARLVTVEDRAAEMGDTANIDFVGYLDGVPFEGGDAQGFDLILGSGQLIPGFEEQVAGHKTGEEFDVNVTFPAEYHAPDLAGKPTVFKIKLNEIKRKELPELDDELAKDVSEFDTLQELRDDISAKLLERAQKQCDDEFENELVSGVIAGTEIDLPEVMIERRIDEMLQDFNYRLQSQGMNLETYMQYTGENIESFRKTFREQAERHVRIRLALEQIAKEEGFQATAEEIEAEYQRLTEVYGAELAQVKEVIHDHDVALDIVVNKAIDLVKESAQVVEEKPKKAAAKKPAAKKTTTRKTKAAAEDSAEEAPVPAEVADAEAADAE